MGVPREAWLVMAATSSETLSSVPFAAFAAFATFAHSQNSTAFLPVFKQAITRRGKRRAMYRVCEPPT